MPTEDQLEDLPGFASPREEIPPDILDPEATVTQPSPSQGRPRISASPEEIADEARQRPSTNSTSSRASSDDIDEALEGYGAGGFFLATVAIDKLAQARTKSPQPGRWLATEEETQRFGEALGRVAARRVPAELVENEDAADYLVMGEVMFTYALRTTLNLTPEQAVQVAEEHIEAQAREAQAARAAGAEQTPQYATSPPAVPPPRIYDQEPAETSGVAPATPPPPDVISPAI